MSDAPEHDEETAAETIRRLSQQPGGVLVQTTHWRSAGNVDAVYWGGACAVFAFVFLGGFAPEGASDGERITQLLLLAAAAVPAVAWWLFVRGRGGVVVGPTTVTARRLVRRSVPLDPTVDLERATVSPWGRRSAVAIGARRGFLLPTSKRFAIPAIRAHAGPVTDLMGCRLVVRPARPWYLPAARSTVLPEVVWPSNSTGHDVLVALGFDLPPEEPVAEPKVNAGRPGESAAERLERWNRNAA